MADKLLPCPFCGGEANIEEESDSFSTAQYVARCKNCLVEVRIDADMTKSFEYNRQKVTEKWNNRPSPWHTGTPSEEGFWLIKYKCVVEGKYNGRLTYRAVKIEKDKIDGFAYESGGIGAEEYWKPIEYQKIDDLWEASNGTDN